MNLDIVVLVAGGLVALLAGGLVAFVSPGRFVSLLAGASLSLLGLLQFGFARAVFAQGTPSGDAWFEQSLALGLGIAALWVLLSATLGRTHRSTVLFGWRLYLLLQGGLTLVALAVVVLIPAPGVAPPPGEPSFPLRGIARWIVAGTLLNLVLLAANFEATHAALPRRSKRAFRPALLGIVLYAGFFAYLFTASLLSGRMLIGDLSLGAVPIALLSFLLPFSLVRGRVATARITRDRPPVAATVSLLLSIAFLLGAAGLVALTRAAGGSFGRGIWLLAVIGLSAGLVAMMVSNRLRRRVTRLFDPIWIDPGGSSGEWRATVIAPLEQSTTMEALVDLIPRHAEEVSGIRPVTLFLADSGADRFRAVSSTLAPPPGVAVGNRDPLAVHLRRAGAPIRLRGRTDDLEYVSMYVENGAQIAACEAAYAVPLFGEDDLMGFLLCGDGGLRGDPRRRALRTLRRAAACYSSRLEILWRGGTPERRSPR